jgi:hypothetical protein
LLQTRVAVTLGSSDLEKEAITSWTERKETSEAHWPQEAGRRTKLLPCWYSVLLRMRGNPHMDDRITSFLRVNTQH